ncbi:hypothetical protein P7L78_23600 [Tistrella bauzanensis]|uniref:hypothetical protein n=1 Tax=Tistrella TaxID=171436 RepID=UPI0031F5F9C5
MKNIYEVRNTTAEPSLVDDMRSFLAAVPRSETYSHLASRLESMTGQVLKDEAGKRAAHR